MCGKYPKLLPSAAYEQYAKAVIPFLKTNFGMCGTIDYPVNLKCVFYLDKRRKGDLVGYLQAIQDVLVTEISLLLLTGARFCMTMQIREQK